MPEPPGGQAEAELPGEPPEAELHRKRPAKRPRRDEVALQLAAASDRRVRAAHSSSSSSSSASGRPALSSRAKALAKALLKC